MEKWLHIFDGLSGRSYFQIGYGVTAGFYQKRSR